MKIYKVCYEHNDEFKVHTYDFWSYVFGQKPKGLLFFSAKKATDYANELNQCYNEAKRIVVEKYNKINDSFFEY